MPRSNVEISNLVEFLQQHIESIIFCSPNPVDIVDLQHTMSEFFDAQIPESDIQLCLDRLSIKYNSDQYPFQIIKSGGGYQFLTKPAYQASIGVYLKQKSKKRLTTSALETLAIIAYKQPVSKAQIEQIRGVNCDYAVQKLLEKELIEIKGKSDALGKPVLYGTSKKFMDYFGINSLTELPTPKDLNQDPNSIGSTEDA